MPINPGQLRQRLTVYQQPGTSLDSFGQVNSATTAAFTIWARVEPLSGTEPIQADQLESITQHRVTVRHSSDAARIRSDWWFVDTVSSRKFSVISIVQPSLYREFLSFVCAEQVTT